MTDNNLQNLCSEAVKSGRQYLFSFIENNTFYDQWYSSSEKPPVEHSSSPLLCFFSALALKTSGGIPESVKTKFLSLISSAKKGDSYGYDHKAPIDSDDTAFALRTLLALGESVSSELIANAFMPFTCGTSWFTFSVKDETNATPEFHCAYQGPSTVIGPHPEVHLNILALHQEANISVTRIPSIPQKDGLPVSYFYNSALYAAWIFSTLCKKMEFEFLSLRDAVLHQRLDNGSWPGKTDGFSAVQETSLALLTLDTFSKSDPDRLLSLKYILGEQKVNGSFQGGTLWRYPVPQAQGESYWYAVDSNSIVSTSLAMLALINAAVSNGREK